MATETHKIIYGDQTSYRVRPNPDSPPGDRSGVVLEWSDDGTEWKQYFFIAPDLADEVADAIKFVNKQEE
jgi:hypothetical protein